MTLVATPGAANANSFVTVETALAYQVGRPGAEAFADLDTEEQEALLIWATQDIALGFEWMGAMVSTTQALPFPMQGQADAYGRLLATNIIPPLVEQATALYALTLHQAVVAAEAVGTSGQTVQRLKKGDTEVWYSTSSTTTTPTPRTGLIAMPSDVLGLLRLYGLRHNPYCVPLVRT